MGLEVADEEEGETVEMQQIEEVKKKKREFSGTTESMKQAQKYLRVHRIFEFFQFTISHMLSALPGKYVDYLLNACHVSRYRSPSLGWPFNHECAEDVNRKSGDLSFLVVTSRWPLRRGAVG